MRLLVLLGLVKALVHSPLPAQPPSPSAVAIRGQAALTVGERVRVRTPDFEPYQVRGDVVSVNADSMVLDVDWPASRARRWIVPIAAVRELDRLVAPALGVGQLVRVRQDKAETVGRFISSSGNTLVLQGAPAIRLVGTEEVWVRRNSVKQGAIIGGATGVGLGAAFAVIGGSYCESYCPVQTTVGLGASFALIGAGIGAFRHTWVRRPLEWVAVPRPVSGEQ